MAWPTAAQSSFLGASLKAIPPHSASAHRLADRDAWWQVAVILWRVSKGVFPDASKVAEYSSVLAFRNDAENDDQRALDNRRHWSNVVD
jgi:hypothetical protein